MRTEIKTFNPVRSNKGILPEEYLLVYPELGRHEETRHIRGIDLMFCWYYGSKESAYYNLEHSDKCYKIAELVYETINKGRSYDEKKLKLIYTGVIPREWYRAIEFFTSRDTSTRARAKSIIEKMFDEYEKIIDLGVEGFKDGDGIIDYNKYSTVMGRIQDDLDSLVKKKEEGYGISENLIGLNENETEGDYWNRYYLKQK